LTDTHEQTEPFERDEPVRELQAHEHLLPGVLGGSQSFVTVDDGWRITFINAAAERRAGMTASELLGNDLRELALAMVPQVSLAAAEKAMSEQVITEFEVAGVGRELAYHCTAYPLADGGLAICARDVSEQERADNVRRASADLYRELVQSVNSAVLRWDRDGVITFMNEYAVQLFGWEPEEVVGGPVTVLVPPPEPGGTDLTGLDKAILAAPERHVTNINENVTRDGRRLWMAWTNRALRDEEGEVREVLAIGNDVTELVRAQAALRESEERYRTIVELADEDLVASSDGTYSSRESVADDVHEQRRQLRARLIALAAWVRRHRLRGLLVAIAFELAFLVPMGLLPTSRHVLGLPGSLLTLIVVITAVLIGWRAGIAAAVVGGVVFWGTIADFGAQSAPVTTVISTGIWIAAALVSGLLADALRDQTRKRKSAAVALARAETMREHEAERATQEERTRIARDLHDSVTQSLFAATLKAEALSIASGEEAPGITAAAEDVRRLSRGALAQMRTLLLELRGDPVDDVPLQQLLRNLVEAAESRANVKVALTLDEGSALPQKVHETVYRITQEALNNVVRHAKAQTAWVQLGTGPSHARLVIGDDGCGFDHGSVEPGHFGLKSMGERVSDSGGKLAVRSAPGEGTVLEAEWRSEGSALMEPDTAQRSGA
jgi:PAS domain S-box-containing protein